MSEEFSFRTALNIRAGYGALHTLGIEVSASGAKRVLMVTDSAVSGSPAFEATRDLISHYCQVEVFDDVIPNPTDLLVDRVAQLVREKRVDLLLGFGGGSVLDTVKGAAIVVTHGGSIVDYDGTDKVPGECFPVIAVPTTAGTGSEVSSNAAITHADTHYKMSIRSLRIIPRLAILDPTTLVTLPRAVAAGSAMDALVHALESLTSRRATTLSQMFAVQALELISANIKPFCADRANTEAGLGMLLGSALAAVSFSNAGTGNAHALARAVGGRYNVPHGPAVAIFLPHVLRFNLAKYPEKAVVAAQAMGRWTLSPRGAADFLVSEVERLMVELDLPRNLRDLGVNVPEQWTEIAEVALGNSGPNPRDTALEDMVNLLERAS